MSVTTHRTRRRRRPASRSRRRQYLVVGIVTLLAGLGMMYIGYTAPNGLPWQSSYRLYAHLRNATNLVDHDEVKIAGRLVGQVLSPAGSRHGYATVELVLDSSIAPLRAGTTLRVRPRSVIGVPYVQIYPSATGRPLPSGSVISARDTSAAVPLTDAFNIFRAPQRGALATVIGQLGEGFAARGPDVNLSLQFAPGFLTGLEQVSGAVNARVGAAAKFIAGSAGAVAAANPVRTQIADGFHPEAAALTPFSTAAPAVRQTLSEAPGTLDAAAGELPPTIRMLGALGHFAAAVRTTLAPAPAALSQTKAMLTDATPGLREAIRTLHVLRAGVPPTVELLNTIHPVLPLARAALTHATPIVRTLAGYECDLGRFWSQWASATAWGDSAGQFLRLSVVTPNLEQFQGGFSGTPIEKGFGENPYPGAC